MLKKNIEPVFKRQEQGPQREWKTTTNKAATKEKGKEKTETTREEGKQPTEQLNNQNEWQMVRSRSAKTNQQQLTTTMGNHSSRFKWGWGKGGSKGGNRRRYHQTKLINDCFMECKGLQPRGETEGI